MSEIKTIIEITEKSLIILNIQNFMMSDVFSIK